MSEPAVSRGAQRAALAQLPRSGHVGKSLGTDFVPIATVAVVAIVATETSLGFSLGEPAALKTIRTHRIGVFLPGTIFTGGSHLLRVSVRHLG